MHSNQDNSRRDRRLQLMQRRWDNMTPDEIEDEIDPDTEARRDEWRRKREMYRTRRMRDEYDEYD